MSKIIKEHVACPCGESSDAYCVYDDGHGFCFSCSKYFEEFQVELDKDKITYSIKPQRGLSQDIVEFFGITTKIYDGKDYSLGYIWPNGIVKERFLGDDVPKRKRFRWNKVDGKVGEGLFGMDKFPKGSYKTLTICEGPIDVPSIFQATNKRTAAVCVDSSSSALKDIKDHYDYVNSFEKIVLALDNDEAGERATKQIMSLFQNPEKLYVIELEKDMDCNDYVDSGRSTDLYNLWINAKRVAQGDFIHTFDEISESLRESVHDVVGSYPLEGLQTALRGPVRGEVTLFKGLEGIGKTELFRTFQYHILKNHPDVRQAVIHMEEDKSITIKGVATHEVGYPMYFEEDEISEEDVLDAYKKAVGFDENRFYIYKLRGSDDPKHMLTSIRGLIVSSGVDIVWLDNLNKMVDSIEEDRERQLLVYLAAKLKDMAGDLRFSLQMIGHVNDDGKALGSRYTTKVVDKVVHMNRNIKDPDLIERNRLYLEIEKGRLARGSGSVGWMDWNSGSYALEVPKSKIFDPLKHPENEKTQEKIAPPSILA